MKRQNAAIARKEKKFMEKIDLINMDDEHFSNVHLDNNDLRSNQLLLHKHRVNPRVYLGTDCCRVKARIRTPSQKLNTRKYVSGLAVARVTRRVTTNFKETRSDLLQDGMLLIRLAL